METPPQNFKIHVDSSFDTDTRIGKLAWVVYMNNELVSTNILPFVHASSNNELEKRVFSLANQVYEGAKIYTDSAAVWHNWKGKNKNRIYLIDHNDNLADDLLHGKTISPTYIKVPTFRFEYIRVKED